MSATFVIPASAKLADTIATLRPLVHGDPKVTRPLYVAIGNTYVDDVVDGLVLDFIRESGSASPRTVSLVETLAGLIKSVSHALVGQAFGKMDATAALSMLGFLDERLCRFGDGPGLGVPIDPPMVEGITRASAAASQKTLASDRASLLATMHAVIDRAIDFHYVKPFSMLELGFLVKKGVDVGERSIRAGAHSTIEKAIGDADETQLADLAAFLKRRLG